MISPRNCWSVKSSTFTSLIQTCMCGGLPSMRARISVKSFLCQIVDHVLTSNNGVSPSTATAVSPMLVSVNGRM